MRTTEMIMDATEYATKAHSGQFRKGGKTIPYITHPIAVMEICREKGGSIEAQLASVLHDIVEDCEGYTLRDISRRYGTTVGLLVDFASESDKSLPWKVRKERYIERLEGAPYDAVVVSAADKLHNLRCTYEDIMELGDDAWSMFNSPRDHQFWFYESLIRIYDKYGLNVYSTEMKKLIEKLKLMV